MNTQDGQLYYNLPLGLDFEATFDIYIENTDGKEDGNGFGFFMGDSVPPSNGAITNGWIFNAYNWTPGGDQFLIYNNSTLVHALGDYEINPIVPVNQTVSCRVVASGGNTLQFYIDGVLQLTYTFPTAYQASYTYFGFLARNQGVNSEYRISNLLVTSGVGVTGKFNVRMPTIATPYLIIQHGHCRGRDCQT